MKKDTVTEDKVQDEQPTKIKHNGKHKPPIKTPATDTIKNVAKGTNGLNQAGSIHNELEPGDKRK